MAQRAEAVRIQAGLSASDCQPTATIACAGFENRQLDEVIETAQKETEEPGGPLSQFERVTSGLVLTTVLWIALLHVPG